MHIPPRRVRRRFIYLFIYWSGCHSDNEEDRTSRNGRQENLEFKDEEETVTTKSIQITQATETTTTTTRKRSGATGSKALDLGAAAHYTGDRSPEEKVPTQTEFQASDSSDCSLTKCLLLSLVIREATLQQQCSGWPVSDWSFTQAGCYSR